MSTFVQHVENRPLPSVLERGENQKICMSNKTKLELDKDTIRRLHKRDLEEVVGGWATTATSCGMKCPGYPTFPSPGFSDDVDRTA